ncbi:helicase-related protein [uncultured Desulfobulbus sp.]|uniref:helicase-related protein n=1 Tax=uncultured Desulfobulbus sp. TaxID=239745 RepID=UPI0029C90CAD|nr:helicase-related protein [uncultured Desulfobulbus sp.]
MSSNAIKRQGGDLFIVDNSDADWKVLQYLREWTEIAHAFDIATGFFEIGSLLALDGQWQKLDKIRILLGDEMSKRTRTALLDGVKRVQDRLDESIESEKEKNDFLAGVPAIVEAMRSGQIECRVYNKDKFHAKAYITHAKQAIIGSSALVGSSNFTVPGLTQNVELNIQIRREVELLQEWYEGYWSQALDISADILKTIEHHTRDYSPFEIYAKALQEFFRSHEITASEWDLNQSKIYPILDEYQKEGYHSLIKIARNYGGAFLCDGVGLGKTFIGMMVIERLIEHERKRVALFVPKAARKPVWEAKLKRYLGHQGGDFSNLVIFNHTDLNRGGEFQERLERIAKLADVIVIDEAHHFRNPGILGEDTGGKMGEGVTRPSRYRRMYELAEGKELYLLTATPINNKLIDLQHMIELFSRKEQAYFKKAPLGIHSLPGHFRILEKALQKQVDASNADLEMLTETNQVEAEEILFSDRLFRELVVQRSRAYVQQSQKQQGIDNALFPRREDPKVADYSIKKTYGNLLTEIEDAFSKQKPLFSLAIYYPLAYYIGPDSKINVFAENRQKAVVALIRTLFLKRFESSVCAFESSCEVLLMRLLSFFKKHANEGDKRRIDRWEAQHASVLAHILQHQSEINDLDSDDEDDDLITPEMLESVEELSREEYNVDAILDETILDLDQIASFLKDLMKFKPSNDDKLRALIRLLKADPVLSKHKVLVFTEYQTTARYLKRELEKAGITGVDEVDSSAKRDRGEIVMQFSPYYNDTSSEGLAEKKLSETRVLISTDVLSEGLNLQDATRLINYDLHWNPVRLMQRIGRVDRRLDPMIEARIVTDHPDQAKIRGTITYWNFLPPDELDNLLNLYGRVSHKTLRISKVFGIEGKKLLTPDDDFDALKDFTHEYEGSATFHEKLRLEYQQLLKMDASLEDRLKAFPSKVFSGKDHPSPDSQAIFFCYALPAAPAMIENPDPSEWTEEAGQTGWYLYVVETGKITAEPAEIVDIIRCDPDTPRKRNLPNETLTEIRAKVERHIKNTYLKSVQAPIGVKPALKAWMELA